MRKADYQTLAAIIREESDRANIVRHERDAIEQRAILASIERVARTFAARASVDQAAFLKACGIELI